MIRKLPLLEDEGFMGYVAKAHERQKMPEELTARRQVHQPVVLLTPDKRCGMNRMILVEAHLDDMSSQMFNLSVYGLALIVQKKRDDVIGRMMRIRTEVARFIYEYTQSSQIAPRYRNGGEKVPAQGRTRAFRPAPIYSGLYNDKRERV